MFSLIKKLFVKRSSQSAGELSSGSKGAAYEMQKKIAHEGDAEKRLRLAKDKNTHKEILYYLAEHDSDPKVRKAVVNNKSLPVQAGTVLAKDIDVDVRLTLAKRLVELLPELSKEEHSQLYAYAVQSLGTLALDEVLKIRKALSSTLKDSAYAPPKVVGKLAHDVEREVSEPILRFCVALSDEELLDILAQHPEGWAIEAIAGRQKVSNKVSRAVINTKHRPAGSVLLENEGADISDALLKEIVEKSKACPEWQKSIAGRKNLPVGIAKALAGYADASVRDILLRRDDFDEQTIEDISQMFRRRLDYATEKELSESEEGPNARAFRLHQEGRLGDETISDALAMKDREFIYAALSLMSEIELKMVEKIFDLKAAKPIIALCWKAGISMRLALKLQQELAHIPPKELVYPKGGTDYPMSRDEMLWQLEFVGVEAA
jgi:uncharacterized protein (DUF2336 family)